MKTLVLLLTSFVLSATAQSNGAGAGDGSHGQVFMKDATVNMQCIHGPWQIDFGKGASLSASTAGLICVGGTSPIHFGWLGQKLYVYAEDGHVYMQFGTDNEINEFKFGVK